jgi:hypothetical protein
MGNFGRKGGGLKARYILRYQIPVKGYEQYVNKLVNYCKDNHVDEVFLATNGIRTWVGGIETIDEAKRYSQIVGYAMDKLRSIGVDVSINVGCTIGHSDFNQDLRKLFPFQFQVDVSGVESKACPCPLDPKWQSHISEIYRIYASLKPKTIWVDDDFRLCSRPPVRWGCFCPLHLEEFARRFGKHLSREELVREVLKPSYPPTEARKIWFEVLGDTMIHAATVLEKAVHQVSPNTRIGLMTVWPESHSVEGRRWHELLKALSGQHRPAVRPLFLGYPEGDKRSILQGFTYTLHTAALVPRDTEIYLEVENYPNYTVFGKSAKFIWLQTALSQLYGFPDVTINFGSMAPIDEEPKYGEMLKNSKPFFNAVTELVSQAKSIYKGVGLFFHEQGALFRITDGKSWDEFVDRRPWDLTLPLLGFSITYGESDVYAVSGDSILALSDSELRSLLKKGLILDAGAAKALCMRGFSHLIGVEVGEAINNGYAEEILDEEFGKRPGEAPTYIPGPGWLRTIEPHPGARVVSQIVNNEGVKLTDGLTLFENELGGRIAVFPHEGRFGEIEAVSFRNWIRQIQVKATIDWLSKGKTPFFVKAADIIPVRIDQSERIILGVANLSSDNIQEINGFIGGVKALDQSNCKISWIDYDGSIRTISKVMSKETREGYTIKIPLEIEPLGLRIIVLESTG